MSVVVVTSALDTAAVFNHVEVGTDAVDALAIGAVVAVIHVEVGTDATQDVEFGTDATQDADGFEFN